MFSEISRAHKARVCGLVLALIGTTAAAAQITAAAAQVAVTTWHYDNERSGANSNETILNPG
jgi:ABC-type glycerol-3-phosphate transport system substrate-binding protein